MIEKPCAPLCKEAHTQICSGAVTNPIKGVSVSVSNEVFSKSGGQCFDNLYC